jgi:hypothetical protein
MKAPKRGGEYTSGKHRIQRAKCHAKRIPKMLQLACLGWFTDDISTAGIYQAHAQNENKS